MTGRSIDRVAHTSLIPRSSCCKWVSDPEGTRKADEARELREWQGAERRLNEDRRLRGLPPEPPRRFPKHVQ